MPKISALPAAASVNLTDILPEVSPAIGGTTYKATFSQVFDAFAAGSGQALTRVNDTNVTLTLGGSPTTALLNATSITAGWTGTLGVTRGGTGVASVTTAPTASSFAGWDANSNLSANNFLEGYATTATAAATTTLTVASKGLQYFTGVTTQTVTLPVTSTLVLGQQFQITNNSTGAVTVNSSGANVVQVMAANTKLIVTCILTSGTTAASWDVHYTSEQIETDGTFTPGLTFGGGTTGVTYSYRVGKYNRVGNTVTFALDFLLTSKGSSTGAVVITGLPIACSATLPQTFIVVANTLSFATLPIIAYSLVGTTTFALYRMSSGGSLIPIADTDFANTTEIFITGTYMV